MALRREFVESACGSDRHKRALAVASRTALEAGVTPANTSATGTSRSLRSLAQMRLFERPLGRWKPRHQGSKSTRGALIAVPGCGDRYHLLVTADQIVMHPAHGVSH